MVKIALLGNKGLIYEGAPLTNFLRELFSSCEGCMVKLEILRFLTSYFQLFLFNNSNLADKQTKVGLK